jgi:hypothetical protein
MKNTYKMNKQIVILFFVLLTSFGLHAQDDKIKFGAYARALQQTNKLGEEDTLNVDNTSSGHVLVDFGINANPDKKTEIVAIVRFRSDLGGFFGSGTSAQLRQAYVKGIIGNVVNYQVGDLYLQLSPYTYFNNFSEGSINEGRVFSDLRKDYTYYENLNRGNYWWQQGAHTNFELAFKETFIEKIRFDAFFLRNRTSNLLTVPSRFHAGGRVAITQSEKLKIIGNYVNLFDIASTSTVDQSTRNPVTSVEVDFTLWNNEKNALSLFAEGGYSQLVFDGESVNTKSDGFVDGGVAFKLKPANLTFKAGYMHVGPEFFSSAAQTKRVNFSSIPTTFPVYGNDFANLNFRNVTIFDLVRDPNVYNVGITPVLMPYDPTLSNVQPYGKATPNRKGFNVGVQYKDSLEKVIVDVNSSILSEVSGIGSEETRNFLLLNGAVDFNIHKFIDFKKKLIVTAGAKYESTNRGGIASENVDLTSNLIDLGIEVLKRLDLLIGAKMLMAKGNEYYISRDIYNNPTSTPTGNLDVNQTMYGLGLKYRFTGNTYLTVQNHFFDYKNKAVAKMDYSINQFFILFNMNF